MNDVLYYKYKPSRYGRTLVYRGALEGRRYDRRMAVLGQCDVYEADRSRAIEGTGNDRGTRQDAILSVPTPDHYLPLLHILGLRRGKEPISFPVQGVDGGSVSILRYKSAKPLMREERQWHRRK